MIVSTLSDSLSEKLKHAEELWVATAMISDKGYRFLQNILPPAAVRNFLIGVDLPTSVAVLKAILSDIKPGFCSARIGKPDKGIFHPKLYLVKFPAGYVAYLGSANLTEGGLASNTELSVEIADQEQCSKLLDWFKLQYANAYPLNAENIARYEQHLNSNPLPARPAIDLKLQREQVVSSLLDSIDFSDRYFKKEDHLAFRKDNWKDKSPTANKERHATSQRFLDLHDLIYPKFSAFGLKDLYPNQKPHIVSMTYHHNNSQKDIDAMWLSYGKSPEEIKKYHAFFPKTRGINEENDLQSFINHARLQVRIELEEINIWILFGKNNGGSRFDRDYFLKSMREQKYRNDFYDLLKELPEQYWIEVDGHIRHVSTFLDADSLFLFCKKDDPGNYFIIGRDYAITDDEMSEECLPGTTLTEFKRLLPLYKKMRHYF